MKQHNAEYRDQTQHIERLKAPRAVAGSRIVVHGYQGPKAVMRDRKR
jgi:hypothetical protein